MTPEEKSLLERTLKISEENNKILHTLRRSNRFSILLKVVYWVLILGISFGAFFAIQPYIDSLRNFYGTVQSDAAAGHNAIASFQSFFGSKSATGTPK